MPSSRQEAPILEYHVVTAERLADLARFSGQHGKFRYCSYVGSPSTFRRAGFHDVTPSGQARQVMRCVVGTLSR